MQAYREFAPPPALASAVECFWTGPPASSAQPHRVFPDGCTDVLFNSAGTLEAIGAMTEYRDFAIPAGELLVGARFRPGGWPAKWGPPTTDQVHPFQNRRLLDRLLNAQSPIECARILAAAIPVSESVTSAQRAIAAIERTRGCVSIDEIASHARLSPRQFRRVCLELTGLTPKLLSQILRFRHAQSRLATVDAASLALDCGYYDQAHFINEFRRFSGRTPMADFSNRLVAVAR